MLDLLKYFQEDKNTYSAQQIVLYNFDEQQSAHFIQDVLEPFGEDDIHNAFEALTGEITQMIPMTSAVHVNGVKLYQYLHQGIEVERPTRKVMVKNIELLSYDEKTISFKATVSKGT